MELPRHPAAESAMVAARMARIQTFREAAQIAWRMQEENPGTWSDACLAISAALDAEALHTERGY